MAWDSAGQIFRPILDTVVVSLADAIKDGPASGIFDAHPASVRFPNATAFAYYLPVK
jgi:hypothetical protein